MDMETETPLLLEKIFADKGLADTTQRSYNNSVAYFEEYTDKTIYEVIQTHEKETQNGILWRDSTLKGDLVNFRKEMYDEYKKDTAREYYGKIIAILNFYEVTIGKLPPIRKDNSSILRDVDELPDQETLKLCVNLNNNQLLKASALMLAHTGLSPVDLLKMTFEEYLKGTEKYHNYNTHRNIKLAISEMKEQDVIGVFKGERQKTKTQYITFASPEAIKATNMYILTREDNYNLDSPVFKTSRRHFNKIYQDVNDKLKLGVTSEGIRVFSPKNLRSYHATQLEIAGMSDSRIDILQGRKPQSIIRKHYVKVKVSVLLDEYIRCLPYLVVEDINRVKTELDVTKEQLEEQTTENTNLKRELSKLDDVLARLNKLESERGA